MKRVLMMASVASMLRQCHIPNIVWLQKLGYSVDVACNFKEGNNCSDEAIKEFQQCLDELGVRYYQIDFTRNVMNLKQDYISYKQVNDLMAKNKYAFIHCHTPIGGVIGRLSGRRAKTKVIYTAHGFHFFKGAPLKNWLIYYPVEWVCSFFTDVLVTINKEDYKRAKKYFFAKKLKYIPGAGVDTEKFNGVQADREKKLAELGITSECKVLVSVGELNENKNHATVIKALSELNDKNLHYVIAGVGGLKDELNKLAKQLNVEDRVHLLGFRYDIPEILMSADVFVFPSKREGLPLALMEAMVAGLPLIASRIRGNTDLLADGKGGYFVEPTAVEEYKDKIAKLCEDDNMRARMGAWNKKRIEKFSLAKVEEALKQLYAGM